MEAIRTMRRAVGCLAVVLVACACQPAAAGGDKAFEDVVKQMLDTMGSLTTTLATIRDDETAKSAKPDLRKAAGKWQLIKKKAEGLPPPSKQEKDRLAKEYRTKLEEAQKKLFGEVARVSTIPGGRAALLEVSSVLGKKNKQ
jgi:hypothetical protein